MKKQETEGLKINLISAEKRNWFYYTTNLNNSIFSMRLTVEMVREANPGFKYAQVSEAKTASEICPTIALFHKEEGIFTTPKGLLKLRDRFPKEVEKALAVTRDQLQANHPYRFV